MKAYELYMNDQAGGMFSRKATLRRTYYMDMRKALKDEATSREAGGLIDGLAKVIREGQKALYLLDAAALWECYATVIDGKTFPLDASLGLPFRMNGRRLSWSEINSLSQTGKLPVAVVDDQLRARVEALAAHIGHCAAAAGLPQVDPQATLTMAEPEQAVVTAPMPEFAPVVEAVPVPAAPVVPVAAVVSAAQPAAAEAQLQQRVETLLREKQALEAANHTLRGQLEQMRSYRENEREYAVRAARCILTGQMEEARTYTESLSAELQGLLGEMERIASERFTVETYMNELKTRMETDAAQTAALRSQQAAAEQAVKAAQEDREKAQESAEKAMAEKAAAEAELAKARQQLAELTQSLRVLRVRMTKTTEAAGQTGRQLASLSEFM